VSADPVNDFLSRLSGVHKAGGRNEWSAKCPCRADDKNPSLSVGVGSQGQVLVTCHRGTPCDLDEICRAVGVEPSALWPDDDGGAQVWKPANRPARKRDDERTGGHGMAQQRKKPGPGELVATYPYTDADGSLVMEVLRYRTEEGGKTFRQRCPDGAGGWTWSTSHLVERPLYRLPEVMAAVSAGEPVWVVEGEKDADALAALGHAATCNPMGADNGAGNKWRPEHTRWLAGARVWVVADRDDPGVLHATYVASRLEEAGCRVRVRTVPAPHKDVHDMLSAGGSVDDVVPLAEEAAVPAQQEFPAPEVTPDPEPAQSHGDAVARQVSALLADERELLDTRLSKARRLLDGLAAAGDRRDPGRLTTWAELVSEADEEYRWLIPGVLEEQERVMIVAAEGVGKTMLARQVAICCAAGVHPFTYSRIEPVRTLLVDLENPERIIRRTARRIVESVKENWPGRPAEEAHLWIKPDGVDVLKPADRARLEAVIEESRPKLLVLGPLYKAFVDPGGRSAEAVAIEVATYLDQLRATYGVALWLEHHAPLGNALSGRDLRPMGSAVWMRWPEFGYALAPDASAARPEYQVKQWRGPRDMREWPARLRRGTVLPFEQVE
jgi:hypothetical protein